MNRTDRNKLKMFIDLACDADYQRLSNGSGWRSASLTIAQALEVLDD